MYLFELELYLDMPRSGIAGSYDSSIFSFSRNFQTVLCGACSNLHFHQQWSNISFPKPSSAFILCRLFNDDHSDRYEVIPHCSFDLHFSND